MTDLHRYYLRDDFKEYKDDFLADFTPKTFDNNTVIQTFIDNKRYSYYVLDGKLLSKYIYKDGREKYNFFIEKDFMFPLTFMQELKPFEDMHTCVTQQKTTLLTIPIEYVRAKCIAEEKFADLVIHSKEKVEACLHASSIALLNHTVKQKVAYVLYSIASHDSEGTDEVKLSQEEISKFTGCNQPQVAHVIKDFKENGIVHTVRNLIKVLDYTKLIMEANVYRSI